MYKTCAICDGYILFKQDDICKKCYEAYGRTEKWVKALIKIHKHNYYMETTGRELTFTDAGLDQNGEKLADY